jgi:hypothetical protein
MHEWDWPPVRRRRFYRTIDYYQPSGWGFAGRAEGCPHLLANDGLHRQDADQHPACDGGHRLVLDALGHHHPTL